MNFSNAALAALAVLILASVLASHAGTTSNAAGGTDAINVTNDLLLIYNKNSAASTALKDYYLAHRPMVAGANVLGIACDTGEATPLTNYTTQIAAPVLAWLADHPAKRPQYVVLFYDIPTRLTSYPSGYGSVGYNLHNAAPGWHPFVNNLNAGSLADCKAYVDKLARFGAKFSPGRLVISPGAGGYGNTNFILDNVRHGPGSGDVDYTGCGFVLAKAIPAITNADPGAAVTYRDGIETSNAPFLPHITTASNVAGYACWGGHSNWGGNLNDNGYSVDGAVAWTGNSGWWIIRTVESFNGVRGGYGQGNYTQWFSPTAFGGANYANTPVGAATSTEEPGVEANDNKAYFGLWAAGGNFAECAWGSRNTPNFQAVGDPFVTR